MINENIFKKDYLGRCTQKWSFLFKKSLIEDFTFCVVGLFVTIS